VNLVLEWAEAAVVRIAEISWRASALAMVVLAITAIGRGRVPPRWRFALWLLVLVRFATPATPAAPWSLFGLLSGGGAAVVEEVAATETPLIVELPADGSSVASPEFVANPVNAAAPRSVTATAETTPLRGKARTTDWMVVAAFLWLAGVVGLVLRHGLLTMRLRRRRRQWRVIRDPRVTALYEQCCAEAGVRGAIPLFLSADDAGPATIGMLRPSVVVPKSMVAAMPPDELRLVLLHELAHCRRRDVLIDRVASLVAAMHWFNPVVWYSLRWLRVEREMACDAAVLDAVGGERRRDYGRVVLNVMERFASPAPCPGLVGFGQSASMARRIVGIVQYHRASRASTAVAAAMIVGLVLGGFTTTAQAPAVEREAAETPSEGDVRQQPAAVIEGIVYDDFEGRLAADVNVMVQPALTPPFDRLIRRAGVSRPSQTRTDARGRYRFGSLSAGKYDIWVEAKNRTSAAIHSLEAAAGQKTMAPIIRLIEGGWIEGQVLDGAGAPMPVGSDGRPVGIAVLGPSRPKNGPPQLTEVDAQGRFRLQAAPGTNSIKVTTREVEMRQSVEVRAGKSTAVKLSIGPLLEARPRLPADLNPPIELPLPVEAEREAAAAIRKLGGWYELDGEQHVTVVNMVYHYTAGNIRLENPQLVDTALQHVHALPRLNTLLLKEGQATDEGLRCLRGMEQLERIYMWDASTVTDDGAAHLAALPNLEYIHLSNAAITDKAIEHWTALPRLVGLSLQGNRFSNLALQHASRIARLRELYVGNGETSITDDGLVHLTRLTSLEKLDLQRTQVTDAGLEHLSGLGRLRELWLSGTFATRAGVAELKKSLPDLDDSRTGVRDGLRSTLRDAVPAAIRDKVPPRLAYLAWQVLDHQDGTAAVGPIWDVNGVEADAKTSRRLRRTVPFPVLSVADSDRDRIARPLVLWFEDMSATDVRAVVVSIVTPGGTAESRNIALNARRDNFRVTAVAPLKPFAWGPTAALKIGYPIESPELIKELRDVPDAPVDIDGGAAWLGVVEADGRLASTLRIWRKPHDEYLVSYGARLYAKRNQWPADNDGGIVRTFDDRQERVDWYKVQPEEIDLVRLTRQHRATTVIEDVPLRHDLYPEAQE
jgi:beta-lactamase regulating signal transducer with metallopeptidase domain